MKRLRGRSERGTRARRCRGDSGAVIVEAALMLPLLFALVFGIIDFGNTFNDWISVRQGARDGLRQVIVKTNPTASACHLGSGSGLTGDGATIACYTKDRIGLNADNAAVKLYFTGSFTAGQPVKICVQYKTSSVSGFYGSILNGKILDTEVESLIEQSSTTLTTAFAENSFYSGGAVTWSASCSTL